jgi:hypothetical protein
MVCTTRTSVYVDKIVTLAIAEIFKKRSLVIISVLYVYKLYLYFSNIQDNYIDTYFLFYVFGIFNIDGGIELDTVYFMCFLYKLNITSRIPKAKEGVNFLTPFYLFVYLVLRVYKTVLIYPNVPEPCILNTHQESCPDIYSPL